jgi:hypothetical protein
MELGYSQSPAKAASTTDTDTITTSSASRFTPLPRSGQTVSRPTFGQEALLESGAWVEDYYDGEDGDEDDFEYEAASDDDYDFGEWQRRTSVGGCARHQRPRHGHGWRCKRDHSRTRVRKRKRLVGRVNNTPIRRLRKPFLVDHRQWVATWLHSLDAGRRHSYGDPCAPTPPSVGPP